MTLSTGQQRHTSAYTAASVHFVHQRGAGEWRAGPTTRPAGRMRPRRGPCEVARARGAGRQGRRHTQASRVRKGAQSRDGGGSCGAAESIQGRARTRRLSSYIFDTFRTDVSAPVKPRKSIRQRRGLAAQPLELRTETFPNCDLTCTCIVQCCNLAHRRCGSVQRRARSRLGGRWGGGALDGDRVPTPPLTDRRESGYARLWRPYETYLPCTVRDMSMW